MADPIAFEVRLPDGYDRALDRVTAALKVEGFGVLTRIDVHTTLKEKIGADFRPVTLLHPVGLDSRSCSRSLRR